MQSRRRPIDGAIDEARRVLWRAFQHGTLSEEEFASTLERLESGSAGAEQAPGPRVRAEGARSDA